MERIKQALEKARSERQKVDASSSEVLSSSGANVPASIVYTHTRTIDVAEAVLHEKRIISGYERNSYTDAYKMLRTQTLQRLKDNNWNSIAITSPGINEGKTLTAINLAISLAMEINYTVLLVDADLRHPSVHKYFGCESELGLSDYLTAGKPLSELLIHPKALRGVVILPGGKPLANSAEMLNSPQMARLVEELKARYPSRIILFDLPPLLGTADTLAFSPHVDAVLLVIEDGKTQAEDANRAIELLQGTNIIGTVLNKSSTSVQRDEASSMMPSAGQRKNHALLFRTMLTDWISRLRGKKH